VRQLLSSALGKIPLAKTAAAVFAVAVAILAGHVFWGVNHDIVRTRLLPPDTPPAEYLYLDTQRVLAYLGQIEGGLTTQEKRVASQAQSETASVKGGLLADIGASSSSTTSVEQVVTPAATDRFFALLIKLRSGREHVGGRDSPWLKNLNLQVTKTNTPASIRKALAGVQVGDFVRLNHAHLLLPAYAALAPKVRYAAQASQSARPTVTVVASGSTVPGAPPPPPTAAKPRPRPKPKARVTPASVRQKRLVDAYLRRLGRDPTLPFVAHTLDANQVDQGIATFFVPAGYAGLLDNDRLLAGELTVVGKVIYQDMRPVPGEPCRSNKLPTYRSCTYFDRQTLATFAPALAKAPKPVLELLRLRRRDQAKLAVQRSVTFGTPVIVVLPVAIYQ
jgi:hypothetical protein